MCLNEIMCNEARCAALLKPLTDDGYELLVNPCRKPHSGHHGVAMLIETRSAVIDRSWGIVRALPPHDGALFDAAEPKWRQGNSLEGRLLAVKFASGVGVPPGGLVVVATYVPNSGTGGYGRKPLERLAYRTGGWDASLAAFFASLRERGEANVLWLGDLNVVADRALDHWNPKARRYAGNTTEEREGFRGVCSAGNLVDAFRELNGTPDPPVFSFFSKKSRGARESNKGWRLDYTMVSRELLHHVDSAFVHSDVVGSDHVPVGITLCRDAVKEAAGVAAHAPAAGGAGGGDRAVVSATTWRRIIIAQTACSGGT